MREIEYTNQFLKDYKRESKVPKHKDLDSKLELIVDLLCSDRPLPRNLKDHSLKGSYADTRECHIKPDLLLIYIKTGNSILALIRMGSHAELF
jgi:mRNA interferase YafQ